MIPPEDCETMAEVRAGVDAVDLQIVELLGIRFRFMTAAARIKQDRGTVRDEERKALVIAKEALNGLEDRDVDRGYRWEQGFTLEMYMHEDSQKSRDAFVETGKNLNV